MPHGTHPASTQDPGREEAALVPYDLGPPALGRRLHLNEYRYAHAEEVVRAVRRANAESSEAELLTQYPVGPSAVFREELAAFVHPTATAQNIAVGAGSDEILRAAIDLADLRGYTKALVGVPSYTHFIQFVRLRGLRLCPIQLGVGATSEHVGALLALYREPLADGALVYLGNPNNPTGECLNADMIEPLARQYPKSLFIIDEAYVEFASVDIDGGTSRDALNAKSLTGFGLRYENVIVTRTFSKAFGLAALRVGYAVGRPETIEALKLGLNPKSFSRVSEIGARTVLECLDHYRRTAQAARTVTKYMADNIGSYPCPFPEANFLLVYVGDSGRCVEALREKGIHVRDRGDLPGLAGYVRVTGGTHADSVAVLEAFKSLGLPKQEPIQRFYTAKNVVAEIRGLLGRTLSVLSAARVEAWAQGGTLLGAIRHGGIPPWDDDADLAYLIGDGRDPVQHLGDRFRAHGLVLQRNRTDAYWQVGTNAAGDPISPVHIDIFPYLPVDTDFGTKYVVADVRFQAEIPDCPDAHCNTQYAHDELFPLRDVPFYEGTIRVPQKAEMALERALGPDYMTVARIRQKNGRALAYEIRDFSPA